MIERGVEGRREILAPSTSKNDEQQNKQANLVQHTGKLVYTKES